MKGCGSSGSDLEREVALGILTSLRERPDAVPNGLNGSLRGFSNSSDIRYMLSETLLQEHIGTRLATWPRFAALYSGRNCVSTAIGNVLRDVGLSRLRTLGLSELVAMLEHSRVEPADAEVLGQLRLLTREAPDWTSGSLRDLLNRLLFQSAASEWVEARRLLVPHGCGPDTDEPRRHALAPPGHRLHPCYYRVKTEDERPAVVFFLFCRQRMEAPAEMLAQWVRDVDSEEARFTALGYLADGELGDRVAELVRGKGWLASVFDDYELMTRLAEEQKDKLRRRLVSASQLEQAVAADADNSEWQERHYSHIDLPTALKRIHRWWSKNRHLLAEEHRSRLYPQELIITQEPNTGQRNLSDSSWFMLLALGSFQGMGRTQEEQHRNFIRYCQDRGWWGVFTDNDPRETPDLWMNIIEEYAEDQHDDEEWAQWMGQFPKFYRLRRWLKDYVDLFLSLNRYEERFTLDTVLAPRSDSRLQGGGSDAPPLTRTLKVGSHFVIRELLHHGVIRNTLAIRNAYAPIERVKHFLHKFGAEVYTSEDIYQILKDCLGEDGATFCGDYDIPLRIISSDDSLRRRLLRESRLEDRFIEELGQIEVEGRSIMMEEDIEGYAPGFRLTTAGFTYTMKPQQELGADEGVTVPCRPDFVIQADPVSDEQPVIAVFTDGFEHHRDSTGDDAAKRMALVRAGYLVWSLTWHDLEAVPGKGYEEADLLGENDGHMAQRQRELDASWNTGQIRSYLAESSLMLLVRYLQNPGVMQWRRAVFTDLLRLFRPADRKSEVLRDCCFDFAQQLPEEFQDSLLALPKGIWFAGQGRWRSTLPNFVDILLALPLDALEYADPTQLKVALHLHDVETNHEIYKQEWNGTLRLYNLLQFLPDASWTTTKGLGRCPGPRDQD